MDERKRGGRRRRTADEDEEEKKEEDAPDTKKEIDRLADLKRGVPRAVDAKGDGKDIEMDTVGGTSPQAAEMQKHMQMYEPIKEGLTRISDNTKEVEALRDKFRVLVDDDKRKDIMAKLDKFMSATTQQGELIKRKLDGIKAENDKSKGHGAITQMKVNLYQTHIRRFHQVMNGFNQATQQFRMALKDQTRRQLQTVSPHLTEDKITDILESGNAQDVIKQALTTDNLDGVVREIEERHQGILKLEKQVLEVYELFRDLATLVDLQQEQLDVIENRIVHAKDSTEAGHKELIKAEDYQKTARRRQCCILILVLGIIVAILAPILITQLPKA